LSDLIGAGDAADRLRAFVTANSPHHGPMCRACALPADIMAAVRKIRDERISFAVIAAWLKTEGHPVAANTLARHFREHDGR
jgi:hypothetical protein